MADRVNGHELGRQVRDRLLSQLCLPLARPLGTLRVGAAGHRCQRLGPGDAADARVGGQQALQQGGAGALQAADHDDVAEVDVGDLGVPSEQVLDPQPLHQRPDEARPLYQAAHRGQTGFGVDRGGQHLQRFTVSVVAEVAEAGLPLRGCDERLDVQAPRPPQVRPNAAEPIGDLDRQRAIRMFVIRGRHDARRLASLTTRQLGWGCSAARTQRKHIVPEACPAVVSQFGRPGSSWATTMRTEPSPL